MPANRRLRWLGATLVVAVIALIVALSGDDPPPTAAPRRATPAAEGRNGTSPENATPVDVNLEALRVARDTPGDGGRDPFRFRPAPAPVAKRVPGVADDQVGTPPPPPRVPAGPPPPPPITLKFIGLVQKADGTKIAVLSDGKRPISGQEGEEVEGRYKILRIGAESMEIAYIDGRGRLTIRLTGK